MHNTFIESQVEKTGEIIRAKYDQHELDYLCKALERFNSRVYTGVRLDLIRDRLLHDACRLIREYGHTLTGTNTCIDTQTSGYALYLRRLGRAAGKPCFFIDFMVDPGVLFLGVFDQQEQPQ